MRILEVGAGLLVMLPLILIGYFVTVRRAHRRRQIWNATGDNFAVLPTNPDSP